ncbi:polyhydroxyalkanoate depolymerase [Hydromonas duriensis]|uniref:Poly(3-hydroxybutyrate) depolymerase n=1 Tax=Hydromonas duriensis TaxID=1527608 RepID=A0A4R6YAW5_9BURK|nr:polyhydroxyalkanoate depolymerase [Hydromonas duriensis]TDR32732.1 poly(3-hydroxybutyrate) depolymerase [Hydromonas duriensis]
MLYQVREWQRAFLKPLTNAAHHVAQFASNPLNPWAYTTAGQHIYAGFELLHRLGKDYQKPAFGIDSVEVNGKTVAIHERVALSHPFCHLIEFSRDVPENVAKNSPTILVCAPLSGHHSTLLRDTVRTLLQDHNVFITDWIDARMVPLAQGSFGLNDYIHYIQDFIRHIGNRKVHLLSVCQPTVPVLAAVSLMASNKEYLPLSMTMMGGPIDTRQSPTEVNDLATERPLSWFQTNVIYTVPAKYPGYMRHVYPGFLQHAGFVAMNPGRHASSHWDYYLNLLKGDDEDTEQHRRFYDEYNAVLDLPAEFYLDTIQIVFQEHALPRGTWHVNGQRVAPEDIQGVGLLTVEGELDDISGPGQTKAALDLCKGISKTDKRHYTAKGAGHYGIFSGRRWREQVYPEIRSFIATFEQKSNGSNATTSGAKTPRAQTPAKQITSKINAKKDASDTIKTAQLKPTQPLSTQKTTQKAASLAVQSKNKPESKTAQISKPAPVKTKAAASVNKKASPAPAKSAVKIDYAAIANIKEETKPKK